MKGAHYRQNLCGPFRTGEIGTESIRFARQTNYRLFLGAMNHKSMRKTQEDLKRRELLTNWSRRGVKHKKFGMAGFLIPISWAARFSKGWVWVDWVDKSPYKCAPLTGFTARPAKFIHQGCVHNSPGGYQTHDNEMNDESSNAHSPAPSAINRGTRSPFVRVGLLFWLLLGRFGHHFFFGAVRFIACRLAAWSVSRFVALWAPSERIWSMSRDLYWEVSSDWLLDDAKKGSVTNWWTEKMLPNEYGWGNWN